MFRCLAGLAAVLTAAAPVAAGDWTVSIPYRDAASVAAGRQLYAEHCAACHGEALQGQPGWQRRDAQGYLPAPPHDETGHTWHHPDTQLFVIVKRGIEDLVGGGYKSRMEGFAGVLKDAEILEILAYVKSTWPDRVIRAHNRINMDALTVGD